MWEFFYIFAVGNIAQKFNTYIMSLTTLQEVKNFINKAAGTDNHGNLLATFSYCYDGPEVIDPDHSISDDLDLETHDPEVHICNLGYIKCYKSRESLQTDAWEVLNQLNFFDDEDDPGDYTLSAIDWLLQAILLTEDKDLWEALYNGASEYINDCEYDDSIVYDMAKLIADRAESVFDEAMHSYHIYTGKFISSPSILSAL